MKSEERPIKKHLFICCNERVSSSCCHSKNPKQLIHNLKQRLRDQGLWGEIRVTATGCLGPCSQGISAILFPENRLITQIELTDEDELYELLLTFNK